MRFRSMRLTRKLVALSKPIVKRFYGLRATGDFKSWEEALDYSSSYDTKEILKATLAATVKAKENGYIFNPGIERVLETIQQFRPKRVLDFGGAMGKYYFTLKWRIPQVHWDVVDLPATVQAARELENERLHFYTSIVSAPKPDLVIASSSLQYCQSPVNVLAELKQLKAPIFLDRLPMVNRTRLAVQIVTEPFKARIPVWFLAPDDIGEFEYCWDCGEGIWLNGRNIRYQGFLISFKR